MANRNYDLIERSQLSKVMQEQKLGLSGIVDQSNVAKVGKILGLNYLVLGSIVDASVSRVGGGAGGWVPGRGTNAAAASVSKITVAINVKVVEVESGKIVLSEIAENSDTGNFAVAARSGGQGAGISASPENYMSVARKAISQAAFKIIREIAPQEPAVILVKEKEVMIDMGRTNGIREGQRYVIVREGDIVKDRDGNVIAVDIIEIAELTISRVEATTAYAKVVKVNKDPGTKKPFVIEANRDLLRMRDSTGKARSFGELFGQ
jgi:hypothetical protein